METATKAQLSKIHCLLNQIGIIDQKKELVEEFSNYRVSSSKDLFLSEASNLLRHLSQFDPCDRVRRKIFALAYEAKIIYGSTMIDKKLNSIKLDAFLQDRGTVKKPLSKMTMQELSATVSQFEQIIKHQNNAAAGKVVKNFFEEMGITVASV